MQLNQTFAVPYSLILLQMISGTLISQAIYVAAKLGIADLLQDGAKSSQELAKMTDTEPRSLYRVLRLLASIGIFAEGEQQQFELTPMASYLQSDVPDSVREFAILCGGEPWHWQPWGDILYSVKTGQPAFERVMGMPLFSYFAQHPEAAGIFNRAMTRFSAIFSDAVVLAYDFSSIKTLVDVGGGHGHFLTSILQENPRLNGIIYELPPVIAGAKLHLEAVGLNERCQAFAGNFFESVPSGADAYILKHIIHDWDDERAIAILKNCHRAMPENGKLLLVEAGIPPGNQPSMSKLLDLEMLVMTSGGRERTVDEFKSLLEVSGFRLTKIIPTPSPLYLIEGVRA